MDVGSTRPSTSSKMETDADQMDTRKNLGKLPVSIIVLGMAGSGKTTFVQCGYVKKRPNSKLFSKPKKVALALFVVESKNLFQLMLYLPWPTEDELKNDGETYHQAFERCLHIFERLKIYNSCEKMEAEEFAKEIENAEPVNDAVNLPCRMMSELFMLNQWMMILSAHLHKKSEPPYVVNLDPAVHQVPYPANIDIRDTINYKEVMKQYNLGPNGAILTALNLFTTRFDQAMNLLTKRQGEFKYFLFDTPGQIEVFTWSASGTIITETLASTYPTVIVYVMDVVRSVNPTTFMSNMLYACSILYKMKLPFVIALNKADIVSPQFAIDWMQNFENFQESLEDDHSYMNDLTRSLSLVLDEFYSNIKAVAVSAATGEGIDDFFTCIDKCVEEYETEYRPEYERLKKEKESALIEHQAQQLERIKIDVAEDENEKRQILGKAYEHTASAFKAERFHIGGAELEDEEDAKEEIPRNSDEDFDAESKAFDDFVKTKVKTKP